MRCLEPEEVGTGRTAGVTVRAALVGAVGERQDMQQKEREITIAGIELWLPAPAALTYQTPLPSQS